MSRNFHWCSQNVQEIETASAWLNERLTPDDLVICHQNIGWLLNCRTADYLQATAWSGRPTFTFEETPEKERFLYPADLHKAKYLVVADIDQRWSLSQPNVSWILEELAKDKWPVVWSGEFYLIVQNPKMLSGDK